MKINFGPKGRNPFQGGMGISTPHGLSMKLSMQSTRSQSLSGWDGDFHLEGLDRTAASRYKSQSLSGWDGDFHSICLRK